MPNESGAEKPRKSGPETPVNATEELGKSIPLADLHATLRKLFEETPRKLWYRIKGVRAETWEAVELLKVIYAVTHLFKVAPEKLLARIMDDELDSKAFTTAFRNIREGIGALRERCQDLAEQAGVDLRIWSDKPDAEANTEPPPAVPRSSPPEAKKLPV